MKSNAIIRIVLFSITILLLIAILLAGILGRSLWMRNWSSRETHQNDGTATSLYAASSEINNLKIDWVSGTITVQPGDVEQIVVEEFGAVRNQEMVLREQRDSLEIQFCQSTKSFISFGVSIDTSKDLTITVPRNWIGRELSIDSASASLLVKELTFQEVDIDGASGDCTFENCSITDLDIDTASGDIRYTGTLVSLDCDAASASFVGDLKNVPSRMDMDSASGDLDVTLPENAGFILSIDAMSSDFTSDFVTTRQGENYVCGDGRCRIDINCMSGDVNLRKCADSSHNECHANSVQSPGSYCGWIDGKDCVLDHQHHSGNHSSTQSDYCAWMDGKDCILDHEHHGNHH